MIHVALRDGFIDEHVVVRLDGDEVFASEAVTTRFQIGLAEEFDCDASGRDAELEIVMPDRDVREVVVLSVTKEIWVGASVEENGLEVVISDTPFRYA